MTEQMRTETMNANEDGREVAAMLPVICTSAEVVVGGLLDVVLGVGSGVGIGSGVGVGMTELVMGALTIGVGAVSVATMTLEVNGSGITVAVIGVVVVDGSRTGSGGDTAQKSTNLANFGSR